MVCDERIGGIQVERVSSVENEGWCQVVISVSTIPFVTVTSINGNVEHRIVRNRIDSDSIIVDMDR